MSRRQTIRSEETKQAILTAAGELFAERGFDAVTMREIARKADCSHTAIYIYFKDKESLLYHLSMEPLQALRSQMESVLMNTALSPQDRLIRISRAFIEFCLPKRNLYDVFFMVKASRVDVAEPASEINRIRNELFGLLRQAVGACLPPGQAEDQVLAYARIHFFTLHGILSIYTRSEEPFDLLMARLAPTFDLAVEAMVAGLREMAERGHRP